MSDEERDLQLVRQHCDQLVEHFDSVQIFASRHEAGKEDGTVAVNDGAGNWFARLGQVTEWVVKENERTRSVVYLK